MSVTRSRCGSPAIAVADLGSFRPYRARARQRSVVSPLRYHSFEYVTMIKVEVTKIEEQRNGRFLFSVHADGAEGRMEFPIGIQDLGSPALDEIAVLRSTLGFADDLAASIRLRLEMRPGHP
jgi:hypothetical protein